MAMNCEDGSVVSELTQETKNTMPLLSPMTPLSTDKVFDTGSNYRPLAAAPTLGEESDGGDSYLNSPGKTSTVSSTSVSVSLMSKGSLMHLHNRHNPAYREGSNSTANSSLKKTALAFSSSNHGQTLYGMRDPSQPIAESSSDDETISNIDDLHSTTDVEEVGGEDGYGTEDESVVSARSLQRRQSVQHKKSSSSLTGVTVMNTSDHTEGVNNSPESAGYDKEHSGSINAITMGAFDHSAPESPSRLTQSNLDAMEQSNIHQQEDQEDPQANSPRTNRRAGRRRYKEDPTVPPVRGVARFDTGDSTTLIRSPRNSPRKQEQPQPSPPQARRLVRMGTGDSTDLATMRGAPRRGRRDQQQQQQQPNPSSPPAPASRGVMRMGTGDSTDLTAMRSPRRGRRGSQQQQNQSSPPAPTSRGVMRMGTGDSTDLAAMRSPRRGQREPQQQQNPTSPAAPTSRGVVRMGTGDSTDLAAMRGAPRRARRRGSTRAEKAQQQEIQQQMPQSIQAPNQPQRLHSVRNLVSEQNPQAQMNADNMYAPASPKRTLSRRASTGYVCPPPESPSIAESSHYSGGSPLRRLSRRVSTGGRFQTPNLDAQETSQNRGVGRTQTSNSMDLRSLFFRRGSKRSGSSSQDSGPNRGVVRTFTANSMDLKMQAEAGGGSGLPRKQQDVYGRDIRRGTRRGKLSSNTDDVNEAKFSLRQDVAEAMRQQRRLSYNSAVQPAQGGAPVSQSQGIQGTARRASTGHIRNGEVPLFELSSNVRLTAPKHLVGNVEEVMQEEETDDTDDRKRNRAEPALGYGFATNQQKTAALLASKKMGSKKFSSKSLVSEEESTIHGFSEKGEIELLEAEISDSEISLNSAKNTMRRNSIQSSLAQDPLAASLLTTPVPGDQLLVGDEHEEEHDPEHDQEHDPENEQDPEPEPEGTNHWSHAVLYCNDDNQDMDDAMICHEEEPAGVTAHRRSIGVDCEQHHNVSLNQQASDSFKLKENFMRAAPFTTPHAPLTKEALEKSNQTSRIPLEHTISRLSARDLKPHSSCDSSSDGESEFGENLYLQASPTLDEFDKYKQRPRSSESVEETFLNMEKMIASKSENRAIPDFIPAATVTNASDFIVRSFVARLRNGITVVKHNRSRWSRSTYRQLFLLPDNKTLSWKPIEDEEDKGRRPQLDLSKCHEVRHAWSRDPETRRLCGTSVLRKKVKDENSAGRSFSLIFAKRTLDITSLTPDSCKVLMEGLSALCFRLQLEKLERGPENDPAASGLNDTASKSMLSDEDWASTVYGEATASLTQSTPFSSGQQPTWGF